MLPLLKALGGPWSRYLLVAAIAAGLIIWHVWPRWPRLGKAWLGSLAVACLTLSLPWVAAGIAPASRPITSDVIAEARLETIIVIAGDNPSGRVHETARLFLQGADTAGAPRRTVWLIGGREMMPSLAAAGVPRRAVIHDPEGSTTRTQMDRVAELLNRRRSGSTALVASRIQMPRIVALAERRQINGILYAPAPLDREPPTTGLRRLIPDYRALLLSRDALYERIALAYYRLRGWS